MGERGRKKGRARVKERKKDRRRVRIKRDSEMVGSKGHGS